MVYKTNIQPCDKTRSYRYNDWGTTLRKNSAYIQFYIYTILVIYNVGKHMESTANIILLYIYFVTT